MGGEGGSAQNVDDSVWIKWAEFMQEVVKSPSLSRANGSWRTTKLQKSKKKELDVSSFSYPPPPPTSKSSIVQLPLKKRINEAKSDWVFEREISTHLFFFLFNT